MRTVRICTLVLLIINFVTYSFAQTDSTIENNRSVDKSRALQFHLIGGYSLSYLPDYSDNYALRYSADLDLNFNHSSQDGDYESGYPNSINRQNSNQTSTGNRQYLSLSLHFLYLLHQASDVRFSAGFGPLVSVSRYFSRYEQEQEANPANSLAYSKNINENTNYSIGAGGVGIAGIEYRATERFSLLAEYRARATYNWNKDSWESKNAPSAYSSRSRGARGTDGA